MMEWSLYITDQAAEDLRGIYEYIAYDLLEPSVAAKLLGRLMDGMNALKTMPLSYPIFHREPWRSRGLRRKNIGNYGVFFMPQEQSGLVVVLRVMYGGRNIDKMLDDMI